MNVHIAIASLPRGLQAVVERDDGDLYIVVQDGLTQSATAVAVAEAITQNDSGA